MTSAQLAKNMIQSQTAVSTTYSVKDTDATVNADPTSASFTVTLLSAVGRAGRTFTITNVGTTNSLTVASAGGNINGNTTVALRPKDSLLVQSDGTNWKVN